MVCVCMGTGGCSGTPLRRSGLARLGPRRGPAPRRDTLVDAGTSKARTSMEMATGGTRVTIRGKGVYDYRRRLGRLKVLLPQDPGRRRRAPADHRAPRARRPVHEEPGRRGARRQVGAGRHGRPWPTATWSPAASPIRWPPPSCCAARATATYVGRTELARGRGAALPGHRGPRRAAREGRLGGVARSRWPRRRKGSPRTRCPFDVYLDDEGRLRKVRHRFSFVNGHRRAPSRSPRRRCCTASGSAVDVRLPAAEDIYAGQIAEQ